MRLYDTVIDDIQTFYKQKTVEGNVKELAFSDNPVWPPAEGRNLVLQSDTAIELGNPADESVSLALWAENTVAVTDNRISLIGPDINESVGRRLPFGKIVLIEGTGFDEDNAYERYREIDLVRFDVSLKGYMMRAASQYMREWSRISNEAAESGFSFSTLGRALITELKKISYIESAEVIFVTSADSDVALLKPMAQQVDKINNAMSKMMEEMSTDCNDCEYEEICDEVAELRKMRRKKESTGASTNAYH